MKIPRILLFCFVFADLATSQVMKEGKVVEAGLKEDMFTPPHHPYTDLLLSSVPEMDPDWLTRLLAERGVENIGDAAVARMN